jgi:hypothetical protein
VTRALRIWIALLALVATDVAATPANARPRKSQPSKHKRKKTKTPPAPPPAPASPPTPAPMPDPEPAPVAPEPAPAEADTGEPGPVETRPLPPPAPKLAMRSKQKAHDGFVDSMDCSACHTSEGWKLSQAASASGFDHDRTGFPLRSAHVQMQCSRCHTGKAPPATNCEGCHRDPHQGRHDGACAECHTAVAWSDTSTLEQHRRTRMPLTGRHATVECTACHTRQTERRFSDTPTDCYACHQSEYHATTTHPLHDGSQGGSIFPRECGRCHQTTSWQPAFADPASLPRLGASPRAIDHDAWFTLSTGSHRNTDCTSCHVDARRARVVRCDGCHLDAALRLQHGQPVARGAASCLRCHPRGAAR